MSIDLDALKAAWHAARTVTSDASEAERTARGNYEDALLDTSRLQPGDIVRSKLGVEAQVAYLVVSFGTIDVAVVLRRKNGTWGERVVPSWRERWNDAELIHRPAAESAS